MLFRLRRIVRKNGRCWNYPDPRDVQADLTDMRARRDYVEARKAQFLAAYTAMTPAERRLARALSEVV